MPPWTESRRLSATRHRPGAGVMAVGLLAIGLAACGRGSAASAPAANDQPAVATGPASTASDPGTTMPMPMPSSSAPAPSAPASPSVAASAVSIKNFAFDPQAITVKSGTTVTWTNKDEEPHTVFSSAAGLKSQVLASNQGTYAFTFTKPGTYDYNCTIHPFMHGSVTVTP